MASNMAESLAAMPSLSRERASNVSSSQQEAATTPVTQRRESGVGEPDAVPKPDQDDESGDELDPIINDDADRSSAAIIKQRKLYDLHPYGQLLTLKDVESCVELENAAFPPEHRCTREKFIYRLTVCPELCSGLFISAEPNTKHTKVPTANTAQTPVSGVTRKQILIAHCIATKTTNPKVQNEDMEIPPNWQNRSLLSDEAGGGHKEQGRTIALHSLAVLPEFQGIGVGKTMLRDYISRMFDQKVGERICIIAKEELVGYYERFGFTNEGKSKATFGGGGWVDMEYDFGGDEKERGD